MWGRIRVLGLGSLNVTPEIYEVQPGRLWISEGYEVDTQKITRLRGDAVKFLGYHYPKFYEDPSTDDLHVKPNRFALRR